MAEQQGQTWLCSIVCIGILSDTTLAEAPLRAIRSRLGILVHAVASSTSAGDRIVADTGDGVALCLGGDPENALSAGMTLHERLRGQAGDESESFRYRIGIHLGSVNITKGADGRIRPIGDGLALAKRVMRFAAPEQLVVSRAFQQVVAGLSQGYARTFRSLGKKHDEHAREYLLYEVVAAGTAAAAGTGAAPAYGPSTQTIAFHTGWEQAELTAAAIALVPYVGERARVVVMEAAERATSVAHFYRLLAQSIPSESDRQTFCRAHGVDWVEAAATPRGK